MPITANQLIISEGYFYIMALSPVFSDYFQAHGNKLPEEHANFIYFEGKVNQFARKNAKDPKWAFTAKALNLAKESFALLPEHFVDCFHIEDDLENLQFYTHVEMNALYKNRNDEDEESSDGEESEYEGNEVEDDDEEDDDNDEDEDDTDDDDDSSDDDNSNEDDNASQVNELINSYPGTGRTEIKK